jgi:integrase
VWRGYVSVPKGGRSRYVPLTARLTAALRDLWHLKGPRVACRPDGSALTQWMVRDFVKQATYRARLLEGSRIRAQRDAIPITVETFRRRRGEKARSRCNEKEDLVDHNSASWNPMISWLRNLEALRTA